MNTLKKTNNKKGEVGIDSITRKYICFSSKNTVRSGIVLRDAKCIITDDDVVIRPESDGSLSFALVLECIYVLTEIYVRTAKKTKMKDLKKFDTFKQLQDIYSKTHNKDETRR